MATETTNETTSVTMDSFRVAIRCRYYGPTTHRGSRITVARWDGPTWGKDPNRLTVGWDDALNPSENYRQAVAWYLSRAEWSGKWAVSRVPDGAVAVWAGE